MKLKSIILITAGMLIAGYPVLKEIIVNNTQQKLMQQWEARQKSAEETENISIPGNTAADMEESYLILNEAFSQITPDEESEESQNNDSSADNFEMLGVLKIEKIKLNLPILEGSTPEILKKGAGRLIGSSDFGEFGNTAISAHRSHAYGRNFNRLNEVEVGDEVVISTMKGEYIYQVFNIKIVEPDDVSLLKKSKNESILTLITCHPLYIATQRLIVQARLVSVKDSE